MPVQLKKCSVLNPLDRRSVCGNLPSLIPPHAPLPVFPETACFVLRVIIRALFPAHVRRNRGPRELRVVVKTPSAGAESDVPLPSLPQGAGARRSGQAGASALPN